MSQSALYSEGAAAKASLTLERLGLSSWDKAVVKVLQKKIGAKPVDGWFGPKSIKKWKAWARVHDNRPVEEVLICYTEGHAIINGACFPAPAGLKYVSHLESNGLPAQFDDTSKRKVKVTQLVLHRGWGGSYKKGRNFAALTERTLDEKGLSGSHTMDIDGAVYQHFDPAIRRGRHAAHHNTQSDSLDIAGPFDLKRKPAPGQEKLMFKAAIGRKNDGKPPLKRTYGTVKCWTLTPEQAKALALFIPWWCFLRRIPLTACEDMRTFRIGGAGRRDPVTNVKGILAHGQIAGPGSRVDGFLPLIVMKKMGTAIEWRSAEDFFAT